MSAVAGPTSAERRRAREREIVGATRRLFDERGMQDAPIEEIARAVGIARGLIYRQFSSKEELYVATVIDYLDELGGLLDAAREAGGTPAERLELIVEAFAGFGTRYPAFLDSSLALMRRPARDLRGGISETIWLGLGAGMARCLGALAKTLEEGADAGIFTVEDADLTANLLWAEALGALHLSRIRVGVRRAGDGSPELFPVTPQQITERCVESAMATVGARRE